VLQVFRGFGSHGKTFCAKVAAVWIWWYSVAIVAGKTIGMATVIKVPVVTVILMVMVTIMVVAVLV
jgi:hypothetical protein